MAELKPCPFCGGTKLKVMSKSAKAGHTGLDEPVVNMTFSVRCNVCHARGGAIGGKVIWGRMYSTHDEDLPQWATTAHILREKAITMWNTRTPQKINHNSLCETETYKVGGAE